MKLLKGLMLSVLLTLTAFSGFSGPSDSLDLTPDTAIVIESDTLGCWGRPKLNYLAESVTGYQAYKDLYRESKEVINICGSQLETCEIQNEELRNQVDLSDSRVVIERDRGDYYKEEYENAADNVSNLQKYKKAAPWIGGVAFLVGLGVGAL